MDEKTFFEYEDVKVTNTRFITGSQTYAMSNVTSVKNRADKPSRVLPIVLLVFGIFAVLPNIPHLDQMVPGLVISVIAGLWLKSQKTTYHVVLATSGGETSALKTHQLQYVTKVVNALNDAIVYRG